MPCQVEQSEKHRRMQLVKDLSEKKHVEFLRKNIGAEYFVTVEKNPDRKTGLYKAVTPNYIKVLFEGSPKIKNQFVKIKIDKIENETALAHIVM